MTSQLHKTLSELSTPNTTDEALVASARAASSEYYRALQTYSPEERRRIERFASPTASHDDVLMRKAELLERFFCEDRKDALHHLKNMRVGDMVIVNPEHTNHMRVACQYNKRKFAKQYRTDLLTIGARTYLRIVRTL
jgi:hypothetical protein